MKITPEMRFALTQQRSIEDRIKEVGSEIEKRQLDLTALQAVKNSLIKVGQWLLDQEMEDEDGSNETN